MSTRATKGGAQWTTEDESTLLLFLIDHKAEGVSGAFKTTTWDAAAIEVNKKVSRGGMKTAESCKSKFKVESPFIARCSRSSRELTSGFFFYSSKQLIMLRPFGRTWAGPGITTMLLISPQRTRAPGATMCPSTQLHNPSAMRVGSIWTSSTAWHHLRSEAGTFFGLRKGSVHLWLIKNFQIHVVLLTTSPPMPMNLKSNLRLSPK